MQSIATTSIAHGNSCLQGLLNPLDATRKSQQRQDVRYASPHSDQTNQKFIAGPKCAQQADSVNISVEEILSFAAISASALLLIRMAMLALFFLLMGYPEIGAQVTHLYSAFEIDFLSMLHPELTMNVTCIDGAGENVTCTDIEFISGEIITSPPRFPHNIVGYYYTTNNDIGGDRVL